MEELKEAIENLQHQVEELKVSNAYLGEQVATLRSVGEMTEESSNLMKTMNDVVQKLFAGKGSNPVKDLILAGRAKEQSGEQLVDVTQIATMLTDFSSKISKFQSTPVQGNDEK